MKVHAIQTGTVRIKRAHMEGRGGGLAGVGADRNWSDWLPTYAWAIEHDEGVIVVDTGQGRHLLEGRGKSLHPFVRWEVYFDVEPEQEIGPQLRALGSGPRDVTKVILTHLHMDHDAGLAHFPGSRIFAARGEVQKASGLAGIMRGYLPQRWPEWFDPLPLDLPDGPRGPFAASQRLTRRGDVIAIATPGHTADHLSVLVEDGDATIFLAGDTAYSETLMLRGKVDGVSPKAAVSAATLAATRQFALERPTIYLPTHDPESAARLAGRRIVGATGYASTKLKGAA